MLLRSKTASEFLIRHTSHDYQLETRTMPAQINAHEMLAVARTLNASTLSLKIQQLRQSRSTDPLQQLQSQAIVELYDVVKQIQEAIWPMLLTIPDISGAREAAQHTVATRSDAISMSTLRTTK
jgi:hypothetical protein